MIERRSARRKGARLVGFVVGTRLLGASPAAQAAPGDACVSGFEGGQEAKKQSRPLKARAELRLCVRACPELLAAECRAWLAEVEGQIGRTVVTARDAKGAAVKAAVVQIDGAPALGLETEVEPGPHVVSVAAAGYVPVERKIDVAAGATVPVHVVLQPVQPPPPPPAENGGARRSLAIGLDVAGAASLLTGVGLLVFGKVEEGRLARTCQPNCDRGSVALVEQTWIGGTVAVGLGALMGVASVPLWLTAPGKATHLAAVGGWVFPGGAGASLKGEF